MKVRGDGYAARSRKAGDAGRPGIVVGGRLRSKGVASGEGRRDILPTKLFSSIKYIKVKLDRLR